MSLFSRKRSRFEERIDRIEKELTNVGSNIDTLTKQVDKRGDAVVRKHVKSHPVPQEPEPENPPSWKSYRPPQTASELDSGSQGQLELGNESVPEPAEDESFASYFMSGGLEHQGPLRGERHVQRNKAIFLILFFLLILFIVLSFAIPRG